MNEPALIPRPMAVEPGSGSLPVSDRTAVLADAPSRTAAALLAGLLPPAGGGPRPVGSARPRPAPPTPSPWSLTALAPTSATKATNWRSRRNMPS